MQLYQQEQSFTQNSLPYHDGAGGFENVDLKTQGYDAITFYERGDIPLDQLRYDDTGSDSRANSVVSDPLGDSNILEFKRSIFSFEDINYIIEAKRNWFWEPQKSPVHILDHVSGIFSPGVNAIMGPSGGGKTSLLNVLAARKEMPGAEGIILLNGRPLSKRFTRNSGFVTQQDILMPTLTVRENIMFSASVRLSAKIPRDKKRKMVQLIIEELNLVKCADSLVGGKHIRGVSGGEKKRCNIGVELVTIPTILFLDEPTTGLDASTAHTVIMLLDKLASKGCNIIMSIHQPRQDIFKMFDTLILLSGGEVVFQGKSDSTLDYFCSIEGIKYESPMNPADFFLDVIERNSLKNIGEEYDDYTEASGYRGKIDLPQKYEESQIYARVKAELTGICTKNKITIKNTLSKKVFSVERRSFATTFCQQLLAISRRTYVNIYRDPQNLLVQLISVLIYSFMVGGIYFNVDNSSLYGIQNRSGAIYFIIMDQIMSNLSAIDVFLNERALYIHEATNGFYRVSVYFFSKLFGDLITMRYLPLILVAVIAYWMIGLQATAASYFMFIFTLLCLVTSGSAIVLLASVSFKTVEIATNFCALYLIMLMVLGGYFVNVNSIPTVFRWLKFLSVFRYGYNALLINEIKDQEFCGKHRSESHTPLLTNRSCVYGNDFLASQGIPYKTLWNLWSNNVVLLAMTILFWLLSYIQLLRLKKNARG